MRNVCRNLHPTLRLLATLGCFLSTGTGFSAETDAPRTAASPLSPEASLNTFALDPDLRIGIVAAEPEVVDPVSMSFGSDGSLWVVEMRDYPYGPRDGSPPKSRISRLFDHDGDGRFETAQVFADQLLFVTGVLPYRDGVIATLAGKIQFFADRDGDGVAEFRETWFSGFVEENSQLRANHPTFGPDGYVHIANGLRGGKIVAERPEWKKSDQPLVITGFDFRFDPETGDFSTVNGHGQFGLTFDDFGRQFVCSNRNPCQHVVFDDRYLKQNPTYGVRQVMHDVCTPAEFSQLYPISKAWTTSTLHANQFTAACGVTIYRGNGLPADYSGNAFTCDPTGNLVHREVLSAAGATFQGKSPYEHREFLASPDTWFRPVDMAHGPDGSLYVVDMYRAVIEHPDWMPEELKTRADLMLGNDRGRIYRISAKSPPHPRAKVMPSAEPDLVAELSNANSFQRDTAFRLLIERGARTASESVAQLLKSAERPVTRGLALRLLQRWKRLDVDQILEALSDPAPEVRETALILAEPHLTDTAVRAAVLQATSDASSRVRFQALQSLTLGPADEALVAALATVDLQDAGDSWTNAAILIAARQQSATLLIKLLQSVNRTHPPRAGTTSLCQELSGLVAAEPFDDQREGVWTALGALPELGISVEVDELRWKILDGLGQGLRRRGLALAAATHLPMNRGPQVESWLAAACRAGADSNLPIELRQTAIQTSRQAPAELATLNLLKVALDDPELTLQQAAFDALATFPQSELARPLLDRFASAAPSVRRGILDVLLASDARTEALVAALERSELKPTELDPVRAQRLTNHRLPPLRNRARQVLEAATSERSAVLAAYAPALSLAADPNRGRLVFEKQCTTCHRIGDRGVNVGPDIGDTRTKTPDALLTAILDPNRAVDNNSFGYVVVTTSGKAYTGLIISETSAAITLRQAEGKTETILRSDIEELRNSGLSLMPVGFEKTIPPEQMADLISFLKNWRYLDGAVPLQSSK